MLASIAGVSTPVSVYDDLHLAGWDCRCSAGDAAQAWQVVGGDAHALSHDPVAGWMGRLPAAPAGLDPIAELGWQAAHRPWSSIAEISGELALSVSTSKGDPAGILGPAKGFVASWPGQHTAAIASHLDVPWFVDLPVAAACATGLHGLLACADALAAGRASRALALSIDAFRPPLVDAGFRALGVLCGDRLPQAFALVGTAPTGFAPGDGAGAVALRQGSGGAGWRLVSGVRLGDASHATEFQDPATLRALLAGLWRTCPRPDLICTHATGTAVGDAYERAGLMAGPWRGIPWMHLKPVIGHCLGASGLVELAIALHAPVRSLWKLSLGFGGHAVGVALVRD